MGSTVHAATYRLLKKTLENKNFGLCVDLGCGDGQYGPLLKKHCQWLIGVDHNLGRLSLCKKFGQYDEVVYTEIQVYEPPAEAELVVMLELIEHLPKDEGQTLLRKISFVPLTILCTPLRFHRYTHMNHHQSLWTPEDLQAFGFGTRIYSRNWMPGFREGIFAVRAL